MTPLGWVSECLRGRPFHGSLRPSWSNMATDGSFSAQFIPALSSPADAPRHILGFVPIGVTAIASRTSQKLVSVMDANRS